jgi:NADH:ubiquinone oxidoreductase subunit
MTIGTRIMTWFRGELVGTDPYGNRYFRDKSRRALDRGGGRFSRERRWVMYNGAPEASQVPPEWHAWLHHTTVDVPADGGRLKYAWQKPHVPNLTGTPGAYRPAGSLLRGGAREHSTADYAAWRPDEDAS